MPNEAVIIAGALDSKELEKSIDAIINTISSKSEHMAEPFTNAIGKMEQAMKNFAITQKVSASTMKDAWREMSASFDAMFAAQSASIGGGNGSGNAHATNTIGALEQEIAEIKKERKEMELNSNELRAQNSLLERRKNLYKEQTTSPATKRIDNAMQMPTKELDEAQKKLRLLEILQRRYANTTELSVAQQNKLARAIQQTKDKIDKIKPKSLRDVLGMDENGIDAITKKMRELRRVQIDPNNAAEVKRVGDAYAELKRKQAELMGQNIQMTHSNNYLAQSFGYIRNRIVYAMTLGAITSFTKQVYEIRGQYELLERSLGVLVNSFERGSQIFQELNQMAIKSPFTLMDLAGAAKQLTAYNFSANEVVDTTRRLADLSAALGVPMERLTYNLGQIRAQTVLTARDARDFANAGLPIVSSLADHFTELEGKIVTTGDVYDRMSKKMVSYSDVMAVLNKMTDEGGKYFDFQAKQAETLRVQMANLNLAWNNMFNDIGKANQGLLTLPVSGLKALFQNWQSIDRVLKSMIITFGLWKALQVVAIRNQWAWASATGATAKQMGFLANAAKGLFASMKALFLNPWTWVFVGIQAIVDLAQQFGNARKEMQELNQEIRDNAKEASESMLNYLNNSGNKSTFELAKQNKLTAEQGEKAWESLKQQIEQSALSANDLISELLSIDDVNKRVAKGFDYAERIQKAQAALQDLKDDSINVNKDYTFLGIGKEGLVTDLKDYANAIKKFEGTYEELQELLYTPKGINTDVRITFAEFNNELDDTAKSINNYIRAYNITDPLQINEILERVRSQIKAKNPEIKDEMARIFDFSLDQKMSELTNGAVDKNASLWNMFMERLKNNYYHAFEDINDEWVKTGKGMSKTQEKEINNAIDANLKYFKDSMPYAYNAVANMVKDASKLRIHIGITFGGDKPTDFQKEVKKRMAKHPILDYGNFAPTANDDLSSWVKTQQEAIKKIKEENKLYARDNSKWSKQKISDNNREIQQRKNNLALFHQQYQTEKEINTARRNHDKVYKKDVNDIASAIKDEISLINDMRNNYEKLRNAGVSSIDALDISTSGYSNTILRLNNIFKKFGIKEFNAKDFAGKDIHGLLNALTKQRNDILASGKVKTQSIKDLDVEIQKLRIEAKTYDMKKITDGLNNELGKLKDEYELAVELDANPEEGEIFADFLKLDKKKLAELPRSFGQLMAQLQDKIDKQFSKHGIDLKFDLSEMLNKENFEKWVADNGHTLEDGMAKSLDAIREYLNKLLKDETKQLGSLVSKYGEASAKIEKIYSQSTRRLLSVISTYGDNDAKKLGINLANDLAIATDPETVMRLRGELKALVQTVADNSQGDAAQNLSDAILKDEKEKVAKALWEEFKDGDYYSVIFDDIKRASTVALQTMKAQLDELKDKVKESPESMKALMSAYSKLREELIERNPFQGMTDALNDGKEAQKQYLIATAELDAANRKLKQKEEALDTLRKKEPRNIIAINRAEKELSKAKKDVAKKNADVAKAQNAVTASQEDYKKAIKSANEVIKKLADALKQVGETLDNTTGNVIKFIGDILNFVTVVSDSMKTVSQSASKSIQAIEKASVILAIISAAIQLIQELNSLLPDASDKYERAARKQQEINKLKDAIVQYRLAVLAARMEEENWFSENSLKKLKNFYSVGREALDDYNEKLMQSQAIYQNEQSGGWLTKFAYWTNPATWIQKILGIKSKWADAIALVGSGLFGAEAQMGQLGIWLTQHANKDSYDYEEGFTAALNNLRIETKKRSRGFLGTGIGGHAQETEDLIKWVRENLKTELFDKDFMLNEEAYQTLMDNYADKLVGETKATLEALHDLTEKWNEYIKQLDEYVDSLYSPLVDNMSDAMWAWYDEGKSALDSFKEYASDTFRAIVTDMIKSIILSNFAEKYANDIKDMYKKYSKGGLSEGDLIRGVADRTGQMMEEFDKNIPVLENLMNTAGDVLKKYGIILDKGSQADQLSNLQQGISQITEDTAGALEAYMNGVSQQVYLHSDLLTQIRDTILGFNMDVQLGTLSQMLLQLQQSYQVHKNIEAILNGVLNPSGRAIVVELNS